VIAKASAERRERRVEDGVRTERHVGEILHALDFWWGVS
jgi:hypothetical protein